MGDDALDVLRDLKKWIRFYDEKMNRMDVARCISDSGVADTDLLQIMALWTEAESDSKFKARLALACLEVLVPLTWPFDRDPERLTVNNYRHIPVLELAQLRYKRAIINFDAARILHTAVRAALPSMAMPAGERSPRDQGVIKLVLYFLRNMAMIAAPQGVKLDGDESQVSRSALIDAFSYQDIFLVLLTVSSNMGDEFRTEDVIVMETLFHLVKRVDVEKLFMSEKQQDKVKADELVAMMRKEEAMKGKYKRNAPTRHSRFGTAIWVKREGGKMSTITGQAALLDVSKRHEKMDSRKSFKPPKYRRKNQVENKDLGPPPKLNARATDQLRKFVEEFLDSGFNPLFQHVRRSIDRDAQHVLHYHPRQFFYLVSWFLRAERARQKANPRSKSKNSNDDISSFNLVAGVLNQEMFITLQRSMRYAWDNKSWEDLVAVIRCFTQILLSVQDMMTCGNEDDEEIADNILSRLFYEDSVHDLVTSVMRNYNEQGFDFLDAATELTHHFVRILEVYSKKNVDMQVRSRRKARKKKTQMAANNTDGTDGAEASSMDVDGDNDEGSEDDDEHALHKTATERKFDFESFAARFIPQGVVDTFVKFLKYYRELDDEQLKRLHRYFYRLAFKQKKSVMLFRVDIIHLLYNMIKGPEPLDKSSGMYKEWEELVKQVLKNCIRKIQERPPLIIEMLFSKTNDGAYYLETGMEKQAKVAKPRPAAELEFKHTEDLGQQIAIVVGTLLDKNEVEHIVWVKNTLRKAEEERRAWMAAEAAIPSIEGHVNAEGSEGVATEPKLPPGYSMFPSNVSFYNSLILSLAIHGEDEKRRTAVLKNGYLRLLMTTVGMRRLTPYLEEDLDSLWTIPSEVTADELKERIDLINSAEFNPPVFEEGVLAENEIRRKSAAPRKRADYLSEDDGSDGDLEMLFEAGGPTNRKAIDAPKKKKSGKRLRRQRSTEPDDEELDEKRQRRKERELEKRRKIKSEMYVRESDDDSDADWSEFMQKEEGLRKMMQRIADEAGRSVPGVLQSEASTKKRNSSIMIDSSDEEDDIMALDSSLKRGGIEDSESSSGEDGKETQDTTLSSQGSESVERTRKRRRISMESDAESEDGREENGSVEKVEHEDADADADADMDREDDDEPVASYVRRPRGRATAGFIIDDSDDE